jgi:hypothetical protein
MRSNPKLWLHYTFVVIAIACSVASLLALFELGASSWTTPLNILSVVCILFALKTRHAAAHREDD